MQTSERPDDDENECTTRGGERRPFSFKVVNGLTGEGRVGVPMKLRLSVNGTARPEYVPKYPTVRPSPLLYVVPIIERPVARRWLGSLRDWRAHWPRQPTSATERVARAKRTIVLSRLQHFSGCCMDSCAALCCEADEGMCRCQTGPKPTDLVAEAAWNLGTVLPTMGLLSHVHGTWTADPGRGSVSSSRSKRV